MEKIIKWNKCKKKFLVISHLKRLRDLWWKLSFFLRLCLSPMTLKSKLLDSSNYTVSHFRELLLDFYTSSGKRKPDQIIIFRFVFLLWCQCKSYLNVFCSQCYLSSNAIWKYSQFVKLRFSSLFSCKEFLFHKTVEIWKNVSYIMDKVKHVKLDDFEILFIHPFAYKSMQTTQRRELKQKLWKKYTDTNAN